ncbi:MAG: phospho-sugar mutase [Dethiobacteria bacterium]
MEYQHKYRQWLEFPGLDKEMKQELLRISENEGEIASCFSRELKFGTGGIRGRMGVGPSRINIYVVRKVSEGLARFIQKTGPGKGDPGPSVVIAYDTRHNSERFAREAAAVFIHWNIKVYLFKQPAPTPLLSFAVRELDATAGVVITASHNPAGDNGYKVYWSDGGQITDGLANAITAEIAAVENELLVRSGQLEKARQEGLLVMLDEGIFTCYLEHLQALRLFHRREKLASLKVVYTPLHGTGAGIIPRALQAAGITNLTVVPEQATADPSSWTIKYPNPEDWDVFALAIQWGERNGADLLLATDLDADRLGVAVRDPKNRFIPLTGNQLGGLLLEYVLSRKKETGDLPLNGIVIKTVVTSEIGRAIAASYGLETLETLTGFKYIGEKIKELVDTGEKTFLFGYEESCGYLLGDFARDKDAVQASQVTAEMAAFYKNWGMTLIEALEHLFQKYGYFAEELINLELAADEMERVKESMDFFRQAELIKIGERRIIRRTDYLSRESLDLLQNTKTPTGLPATNSLKYFLEGEAWFCIRPSGTEPKLKIYLGVQETSGEQAHRELETLKNAVLKLLEKSMTTTHK